jgi:enediyne biosynthesis protein E4
MSNRFSLRVFCAGGLAGAMAMMPSGAAGQMHEQTIQTSAQSADPPRAAQGGSATAGTFAPVLDSEKRPITEGGFVKAGPIVFEDISAKSGLTSWHHTMGTAEKKYILEETGSGYV